ncbi:hypothetical protein PTKIN_Ptkin13bG0014100 [Pterospermum kingtungense]
MDRLSLLFPRLSLVVASAEDISNDDPLIHQVVSGDVDDLILNVECHFTLFKSKVMKFSDLTLSKFRHQFLGLKPLKLPVDGQKALILPTENLPEDFDWRDHDVVTCIKDQL